MKIDDSVTQTLFIFTSQVTDEEAREFMRETKPDPEDEEEYQGAVITQLRLFFGSALNKADVPPPPADPVARSIAALKQARPYGAF